MNEYKRKRNLRRWMVILLMGLCVQFSATVTSSAKDKQVDKNTEKKWDQQDKMVTAKYKSYAKHYGQLFKASGKPDASAKLYVFGESALVPLYADSNGKTSLKNPVRAGKDGVYWFYAKNGLYTVCKKTDEDFKPKLLKLDETINRYYGEEGAYLIHENSGGIEYYTIVEEGVRVFDPGAHVEITGSAEASALTLNQIDTQRGDLKSAIVFKREAKKDTPEKGPWRWLTNEVEKGDAPGMFMLLYNTDYIRGANDKEKWAKRDVDDVCIRYSYIPDQTTGGRGVGGHFNYAVAPKGVAGSRPVFRVAVKISGDNIEGSASLMTVGEFNGDTRFFRNETDHFPGEHPFPLAGACFFGNTLAETTFNDYGRVWAPNPNKFEHYEQSAQKAILNPYVPVADGVGGPFMFATAGKAMLRVAKGVRIKTGDTLVSSKEGYVQVDNSQKDISRIVAWAVEKSGETKDGFVLAVLP